MSFSTSKARSGNNKLVHTRNNGNQSQHFYFNHIPRLWNSLPSTSIYQLTHSDIKSRNTCCLIFNCTLIRLGFVHSTQLVLTHVCSSLTLLIDIIFMFFFSSFSFPQGFQHRSWYAFSYHFVCLFTIVTDAVNHNHNNNNKCMSDQWNFQS